jgi:hypothetical protein
MLVSSNLSHKSLLARVLKSQSAKFFLPCSGIFGIKLVDFADGQDVRSWSNYKGWDLIAAVRRSDCRGKIPGFQQCRFVTKAFDLCNLTSHF